MSKVYWAADNDTLRLIDMVMSKWHKELNDIGLKIGVLFVNSSTDLPAITHGGYPASATIKPVSLRDRIMKKYDVEMLIDIEIWNGSCDESKMALIDHELSHVALKRRKVKKKKKKIGSDDDDDNDNDNDIGR